ncbi:SDR family NAD(P)-dependent oxidoreductase [Spirosoma soli]|uniref:SDR family NAD(P)-dependent oxidoreductase n=1 Tax=Spirosoma soli TaxID=1770529 RepID=A0ABW5M197_9BACT
MATIFLTGAAGGLGRVVTETLLSQGHRIIATVHPGADSSLSVTGSSGELITYEVDLTNEAQVGDLIQRVLANHGPIDNAILLAGGFAMGSFAETDGALLDKMLTLNFKTAYYVVQPLYAHMSQQPDGGRFVLVGARPALEVQAGQHMVAYALSKSLLFELSDLINASGKERNIVSTVLVPSTIDTPANRKAMPEADFTAWIDPHDIADTISFVLFGKGQILREPVLKLYNRA